MHVISFPTRFRACVLGTQHVLSDTTGRYTIISVIDNIGVNKVMH